MTPNSDDTQVGIAGGDGPKDLREAVAHLSLIAKAYEELDEGDWAASMPADIRASQIADEKAIRKVLSALSAQGGRSEPVAWGTKNAAGELGEIIRYTRAGIEKYIRDWTHNGDWEPVALYLAAHQSEPLPVDGVEERREKVLEAVVNAIPPTVEITGPQTEKIADAILAALPSNTGRRADG